MSLASLAIRVGKNLFFRSKVLTKTGGLEQFINKTPNAIDKEVLEIGKKAVSIQPIKYVSAALKEIELPLGGLKMKMFYKA